jgi:hypothetical protein
MTTVDSFCISKIIADDLMANPDCFNSHGVHVTACAVTPRRLKCEDSFRDGAFVDLWLVLKERPGTAEGYLMVFDGERLEFGLAVHGNEYPVLIGYYGSFTETLSAM